MSIIESIQNKPDHGEYAAGVFVDLKKAFDTVDHDTRTLWCQGSNKKKCSCSYLKNRKQFVSTDGFVSNTKHICPGVPQGQYLGRFYS